MRLRRLSPPFVTREAATKILDSALENIRDQLAEEEAQCRDLEIAADR